MSESKRYAINIGIDYCNPSHYGDSGSFPTAIPTSVFLRDLFSEKGAEGLKFDESILIPNDPLSNPQEATVHRFETLMNEMSDKMVSGDLLVVSFCGHTYKVKKEYGFPNYENKDRGWGFYDRIYFHFELWKLIKRFKAGTRIVIISDSCYSDITGIALESHFKGGFTGKPGLDLATTFSSKTEKEESPVRNWYSGVDNRTRYTEILSSSVHPILHEIPPSVVVLSASNLDDEIPARSSENDRTVFSNAFQKGFERSDADHNLSSLFDDIVWYMNLDLIKSPMVLCNDITLASKELHDQRISPQWHYIQGHERTDLRTQKPLFKIGNF